VAHSEHALFVREDESAEGHENGKTAEGLHEKREATAVVPPSDWPDRNTRSREPQEVTRRERPCYFRARSDTQFKLHAGLLSFGSSQISSFTSSMDSSMSGGRANGLSSSYVIFDSCLIHSGPKTNPLPRARTTPRTTAKYSHLSAARMLPKWESR
jgi:hypothetical protein